MANATKQVRAILQDQPSVNTLTALRQALPELKASEISMALCYLLKQRYVTREILENTETKGRKKIWKYQYHVERLSKTTELTQEQPIA